MGLDRPGAIFAPAAPVGQSVNWSLSDEALVAGLATGDADATTAFVRRFQARVFGLAVTMVGDRAVAEEIAQEAFTRAWRHGGPTGITVTWTPRGRSSTWSPSAKLWTYALAPASLAM